MRWRARRTCVRSAGQLPIWYKGSHSGMQNLLPRLPWLIWAPERIKSSVSSTARHSTAT